MLVAVYVAYPYRNVREREREREKGREREGGGEKTVIRWERRARRVRYALILTIASHSFFIY